MGLPGIKPLSNLLEHIISPDLFAEHAKLEDLVGAELLPNLFYAFQLVPAPRIAEFAAMVLGYNLVDDDILDRDAYTLKNADGPL